MPAFCIAAGYLALVSGCSSPRQTIPAQTITAGDLKAVVTPEINPPTIGDNTLDLNLTDSTGVGVPIANISATATTPLTGNTGATESGRSQGNGSYRIPIHTPLTEKYTVTITIERTGKSDVVMTYIIQPQ